MFIKRARHSVRMAIKRPWLLVLAVLLTLAIGSAGSFFTAQSVSTWYVTLAKPVFQPPSWVFGPVWTTLFILMGVALYLAQVNGKGAIAKTAVRYFGIQLFLNFLWSLLFFGLRSPLLALIDILLLWVAIAACIVTFSRISKPAAYLMVPYILWVSFATVLNFAIALMN